MDTAKSFTLANGDPVIFRDYQKASTLAEEKIKQIEAEAEAEAEVKRQAKASQKKEEQEDEFDDDDDLINQSLCNRAKPTSGTHNTPSRKTSVVNSPHIEGDIEWEDDDDQMNLSINALLQQDYNGKIK